MQHQLKAGTGTRKTRKRVGRGNSAGGGTVLLGNSRFKNWCNFCYIWGKSFVAWSSGSALPDSRVTRHALQPERRWRHIVCWLRGVKWPLTQCLWEKTQRNRFATRLVLWCESVYFGLSRKLWSACECQIVRAVFLGFISDFRIWAHHSMSDTMNESYCGAKAVWP